MSTTGYKSQRKERAKTTNKRPDCDSPRELQRAYIKSPELFLQQHNDSRPKTRADCATVPRPCPYVTCRYNMFLDIKNDSGGGLTYNISRDAEPSDMRYDQSCALDIADEHAGVGMTLDDIGVYFGIDRERVRQIESVAIEKIKRKLTRLPRSGSNNPRKKTTTKRRRKT